MRKLAPIGLLILTVGFGLLQKRIFIPSTDPAPHETPAVQKHLPDERLGETPKNPKPPIRPSAQPHHSPLANELGASSPQHDVDCVHALLRQYLRILKNRRGRPLGDISDLALVLTGKNPMDLALLPPDHPTLSKDGRLVDRWGTAYFLHPESAGRFEIRSAGPDRKLFTADDLVASPIGAGQDSNDGA